MTETFARSRSAADREHEASRRAQRRNRLQAIVMLALSLVVIGLVAVAVHSSPADNGGYVGPATREIHETTRPADYHEEVYGTYDQEEPQDITGHSDTARLLLIGAISLGVIALLLLAILVIRRTRHLWSPVREEPIQVAAEPLITVVEAQKALHRAADRLDHDGAADDAIIAAWLAIEEALTSAGVRRSPAETTREYVVRALGKLDLDPQDLSTLAALYRGALFAGHDTTETDRDRARALLGSLSDQLEERTR